MPVLEDGTFISEEEARRREQEYADMVARTVGTGIPTSGTVLGTNYSFVPSTSGLGGGLNLGWDQTPGLGAAINFDPSAGLENAFIGNWDVSGQGMANVGDVSSPNANLSLTAGLQGAGLNTPDPYLQAAVTDVVPGLGVSTGTNIPSQATFSAGNLEDQGYSLGLNKFSGEPTQASFTKQLTPGVTAHISTDPSKTNPSGLKFESSLDDAGKMLRQFWGGVKDVFSPINTAGADASVPDIAVAPSMSGVDYSQALADVGIEPTTAGMATVHPDYWADAPEYSSAGSWADISTDERDALRHGANILGVDLSDTYDMSVRDWNPLTGGFDVLAPWASQAATQQQRHDFANLRDNVPGFMGAVNATRATPVGNRRGLTPFSDISEITTEDTEPLTEILKDIINNQIAMTTDLAPSLSGLTQQEKFDMYKDNPNVVTGPAQLEAMVNLALLGHYDKPADVQASIDEIEHQVDTFKDIPDVTAPSGPTPAEIAAANAASRASTRAAAKAAAAAQRKSDLAAQQAAARRTKIARQALKDSQAAAAKAQAASAAQAKSAQKAAKAVLARMNNDRNTPSAREVAAAREVMSQVDSFGSGNPFQERQQEARDRAEVAIDASRQGGGPF